MPAGWITPNLQLECRPQGEDMCLCEGNASLSLCLCILKVNCKVYEANLWAFITFWPCVYAHMCVYMFVPMQTSACVCLCVNLCVCMAMYMCMC